MKEKLKRIIENSDKNSQVMQTVEELAELTQALMKNINRGKDNEKNILSELADVQIMLEQLKIIFNFGNLDVEKEMHFKINRYFERKSWK